MAEIISRVTVSWSIWAVLSGFSSFVGVVSVDLLGNDVEEVVRFCGVFGSVLGQRGSETDCT